MLVSRIRNSRLGQEYKSELTMFFVFVVFFIAMSFASPYFFTKNNILNVMSQISVNSMLAIGMTIVIITAGIDLSVGAILGLSGMVGGMVLMNTHNIMLGVLVILCISVVVGVVNGFLIGYLSMPAFIVTLGIMEICRSLDYVISDANTASKFPSGFAFLGKSKVFGSLPFYVIFIIVMFLFFSWLLSRTKFGRFLYAIGSNAEAARLTGINIKFNVMMAYVVSGLMCGFGAWMMTSRLMACDPTYGVGNEMDAIAAAVIGGTSMSGGKGTMAGTFIGVLLVGFLRNALNILGVNPFWQGTVIGTVIIVAVMAEQLSKLNHRN